MNPSKPDTVSAPPPASGALGPPAATVFEETNRPDLRILLLEDCAIDAELIMRTLRQGGIACTVLRVETEKDFRQGLTEFEPDVILSDYSLPSFDGLSGLAMARELCPDTPVIFVSGLPGEEVAIEAFQRGAIDYVLKQRLTRLAPAVRRAWEEAAERRQRQLAERRLRHLHAVLRAVRQVNALIVRERDAQCLLREACHILEQTRGYRLVWIGLIDANSRRVLPESWAGAGADYLKGLEVTLDNSETGLGPGGTALRTRQPVVCRDIVADPGFAPWKDMARKHGFASMMAVPVINGDRVFGLVAVYSDQPAAFDQEEVSLLSELAGDLAFALQSIEDETARRQAESLLRLQSAALESVANAIVITDRAGTVSWVNPAFTRLTGYSAAEVVGDTLRLLRSGRHDQAFYQELWETILAGRVWRGQMTNRRKNGVFYTEENAITPVRDEHGEIAHFVAIKQDITEHQRTLEALRLSDERFRVLFEFAPDAFYICDRDTTLLDGNKAAEELVGCQREELIGQNLLQLELLSPEQLPRAMDHVKTNRGGQPSGPDEFVLTRRDGSQVTVEIRTFPLEFRGQGLVLGIARDITERKRSEARIREQARLLDLAQDAIFSCDLDDRVLYFNKGAEEIYGWTAEEALGRPLTELMCARKAEYETAKKVLFETGATVREARHTTKSGREIIVNSRWTLVRDEQGRPKSILSLNTDITERRKLEAQFLRTQRLESIGQLANGIAHDLNNILMPIMMVIPLVRQEIRNPETLRLLETMETSAKRGANIVRQVLTFSRGIHSEKTPLQLRHLVKEFVKIVEETFPKTITVKTSVPRDLWLVQGDITQLHQVLMNLCVNARDAMPDGGLLTLAAENVVLDETFAAMTPHAKAGPYVVWLVADTGVGISQDIMDRIFDPFFTTKEAGKGTGLGLSTVLGIVRNHDGFIRVESKPNAGTEFRIYLPAIEATLPAPVRPPQTCRRGQGELILVVDDEESVRNVTRNMLEKHGFKVLTADGGAEAIPLYVQHRADVRLVLTDIMMPHMDGLAVVRSLRKINPEVRVVVSSGLADDAQIARMSDLEISDFLAKPYTTETLLTTLEQVLWPVPHAQKH